MKLILVILIGSLLVLNGCNNPNEPYRNSESQEAKGDWWVESFNGHEYVVKEGGVHGYGSGIAHNPDCPCSLKSKG